MAALVDTNEKLQTGMAEIIERLVNHSAALRTAVTATGTEFAAAENSLSQGMGDFRTTLSHVAGEIAQFNQSTRATLDEAGSLAETIARHRENLAASAGELSREQAELDRMLAARRESIESLLGGMKGRRDDLEGLATAFSERIEDLYEKSEARARSIGAILADTSQLSGGTIESQFAELRARITEERDRTAAELRSAAEQANSALDSQFGQTADRFQSAAAELRGIAREIQRELEETREALRRSAADLPQETAQQAASLRRAVADQIKALEELSEIVTRSGRAYDISQPATFGAERPAAPSSAPRRMEAVRAPEPSRAPAQPPRAASRPANGKTSERGSGWISDLLARVDNEEPAASQNSKPKPAQGPQRLEAISLDVTRIIDHAAAAEAWERYRRGEANAFSRQIYVGRGPQAFEEIRRRYRLDPEVHATVDRYVQEFERLLAELGQDEADEAVAKTYLLSETGKVYTLLAHAAGKLT